MIPIQISGKEAKIRFNRDFYDMFPITEVCERFENIAKIIVVFIHDQNVIEVTLKPKVDVDPEKLALEFCNHCLHEQVMVSR